MSQNLSIVSLDQIPVCSDVPLEDLLQILRWVVKMENMCEELHGIGLAAAQVGLPFNFFILKRNSYEYYLNCSYEGMGEKRKSIEGCLSLKGEKGELRRFEVDRYSSVRVKGKRLKINDSPSLILEDVDLIENGLTAIVFQHEIDHASGRDKMIDLIGKELEISKL